MPLIGLDPTFSVGERLQTYALDRAATGTGNKVNYSRLKTGTCSIDCTSLLCCSYEVTFLALV